MRCLSLLLFSVFTLASFSPSVVSFSPSSKEGEEERERKMRHWHSLRYGSSRRLWRRKEGDQEKGKKRNRRKDESRRHTNNLITLFLLLLLSVHGAAGGTTTMAKKMKTRRCHLPFLLFWKEKTFITELFLPPSPTRLSFFPHLIPVARARGRKKYKHKYSSGGASIWFRRRARAPSRRAK